MNLLIHISCFWTLSSMLHQCRYITKAKFLEGKRNQMVKEEVTR